MEHLSLEASITTPKINFNPQTLIFVLSGECRPENVLTFFTPVLDWLNEFDTWIKGSDCKDKTLEFSFELEYFNSSSAKYIFNIFKRLNYLKSYGIAIKVQWKYDELDEDLLETGKELEKILNLQFNFVALKD